MGDQNLKRKLTALLSADVEDYSRLMREDEEATVHTITAYRAAMAKLSQQYRGQEQEGSLTPRSEGEGER